MRGISRARPAVAADADDGFVTTVLTTTTAHIDDDDHDGEQQQQQVAVASCSNRGRRKSSQNISTNNNDSVDKNKKKISAPNQPHQPTGTETAQAQPVQQPQQQQPVQPQQQQQQQQQHKSVGQMLLRLLPCNCSSIGSGGRFRFGADGLGGVSNLEFIDDKASFDEVAAWGVNFDRLMKNKNGQKYFAEFLKSEYSDENILFWQACEELKRERNTEKIEEKARIIYEDFISILSPKEVSLDSRVREIINQNMVHPSAHTFDEAQNQIYTLMQRDSYPRFISSTPYKRILSSYGQMEDL
uniref:RGS domain-containing protein n=1 Tax=Globodera rostochiensis TaxID=31243 RepID=A0A914IAG7_GLORO